MIKLQVADYCHECVDFDPKRINHSAYTYDDDMYYHDIKIICKNRDHCAYLRQKWEQEMAEKKGE